MWRLLSPGPARAYPADFLVTRLKGRRTHRFRDWPALLAGDDPAGLLRRHAVHPYLLKHGRQGMWFALFEDYRWVFSRMNRKLGRIFAPYFLYFELPLLINCLRCRLNGPLPDPIRSRLALSLLDRSITELLVMDLPFEALLTAIEGRLTALAPAWKIAGVWQREGLAGFERQMMHCFFQTGTGKGGRPVIRTFLSRLVDLRNLTALGKTLAENAALRPRLIPGGGIPAAAFAKTFQHKSPTALCRLAGLTPGDRARQFSAALLEDLLLSKLTAYVRRKAHEPTGLGFILYYLWEQYCQARNLGGLLYAAHLYVKQPSRLIR